MQITVFGTGAFAVPTVSALIESRHNVIAVVTRPIHDVGRRKAPANPVRELAARHHLPVMAPPSVNDEDFIAELRKLRADLFFVCDFGQILSKTCLHSARLGGINLHGSLLPKYRGAAPVNWAIYHGEVETGVSVIQMSTKMDAGPTLTTTRLAIEPMETAIELESRLSILGVTPVFEAIDILKKWDGVSQIGNLPDERLASSARRLRKSDGEIDWTRSADQLVNQIRAFQPWPGSYSVLHTASQQTRLIIQRAHAVEIPSSEEPGSVVDVDNGMLAVQTGHRAISIDRLQPAGKRDMEIAEFLRGRGRSILNERGYFARE
jgi:methionyl-tRNA formyltransferase